MKLPTHLGGIEITLYVGMQIRIIESLQKMQKEDPLRLLGIAKKYCIGTDDLEIDDSMHLLGEENYDGLEWPQIKVCALEIIREQICIKGTTITIRNLLGMELYRRSPMGYAEFRRSDGSGSNALRLEFVSQPCVLKEGDVLATGERLLSPPREGGNGAVLLHLSGGEDGTWILVPSRIPIALLQPEHTAVLREENTPLLFST